VRKTALLIALLAACRSVRPAPDPARDAYVGGSFSAIPALGLGIEGGKVIHRAERFDLAVEGELLWQFLTDRDLADDGHTENLDDWTQVRVGLKQSFQPGGKYRFVLRYGGVLFRATGTPGIIGEGGTYFGLYASAGFDVEIAPRWTMGPDFRVLLVEGRGDPGFEAVPQFGWHLVFDF